MRLRYKHAEVLMIMGLVISVVVSYYAASVFDKAWAIHSAEKPYRADYLYELLHADVQVISEEEQRWTGKLEEIRIADFAGTVDRFESDVTISFNMSVGHATGGKGVTFFFRKPRDMKCAAAYDTVNGSAPVVYIGKTMEQFVTEKNGKKYLWLNEIEAQVGGVLQSTNIADYDERILLDYFTCNEDTRKIVDKSLNHEIVWGGAPRIEVKHTAPLSMENRETIAAALETLKIRLVEKELYDLDEDINEARVVIEIVFVVLMYAFVIVNQFSICRLWFTEREGEFVVRKRCGSRSGELVGVLLRDFLRLFVWAAAIGMPVMLLLGWAMKDGAIGFSRIAFAVITVLGTAAIMFVLLTGRFFRWFRRINLGKI